MVFFGLWELCNAGDSLRIMLDQPGRGEITDLGGRYAHMVR